MTSERRESRRGPTIGRAVSDVFFTENCCVAEYEMGKAEFEAFARHCGWPDRYDCLRRGRSPLE